MLVCTIKTCEVTRKAFLRFRVGKKRVGTGFCTLKVEEEKVGRAGSTEILLFLTG